MAYLGQIRVHDGKIRGDVFRILDGQGDESGTEGDARVLPGANKGVERHVRTFVCHCPQYSHRFSCAPTNL